MTANEQHLAPRHPIAVAAERTQLSRDILRAWERRYQVVAPGRGAAGERLYSDADIEKLTLLGMATAAGRTISQLAALSVEQLRSIVDEDSSAREQSAAAAGIASSRDTQEWERHITAAMDAVVRLDAAAVEWQLRHALASLGVPTFVEFVAAPFCRLIGEEWHAGRLTVAREHMATSALNRTLTAALTGPASPDAPLVVIGTLAGERHEIGAMLAAAIATVRGWRVLYLGADLPAVEIAGVARSSDADAVAISAVYMSDRTSLLAQFRALRADLPPGITLFAGGAAALEAGDELRRYGVTITRDSFVLSAELDAVAHRAA
jgi:methanogenic corrinoid protein MtbC1